MLTDLNVIKKLCAQYRLKPDKQLGQNFLIDETVLNAIVDAAQLQTSDTVIEIGAGIGTLTHALAERAGAVYAFEVDERLYPILQETVPQKNARIITENVLHTRTALERIIKNSSNILDSRFHGNDTQEVGNYKIVANIPYQVTGALVRIFLELVPVPQRVVIMVQKEVAERMTAHAGKMSMLGVAVHYYTKPHLVRTVPRTAFYPPPRVESAIVLWEPIRVYNKHTDEPFFRLVKAGFTHPRKLLKNNLITAYSGRLSPDIMEACLRKAGISMTARAGELTIAKWDHLSTCLKSSKVVL